MSDISEDNKEENVKVELNDEQRRIFDAITNNNINELRVFLGIFKENIDFVDENGMTPLQHACFKGNKDAVQLLLDQGGEVNWSKHKYNYTALHFAALSGNTEICLKLLSAGANTTAINSVERNPSQMAAFVGNHQVVQIINNFLPKKELRKYTEIKLKNKNDILLPPHLLDAFHKFLIDVNLHPVRIALNLQHFGQLTDYLENVKVILPLMSEYEIILRNSINEVMSFKYHYLYWIVNEIIKCRDYFQARKEKNELLTKNGYIELFAKRVLKENKNGQLDYLESTIRDCLREFPYRETMIFRQIITQLANKDCGSALDIIKNSINGQRGFQDIIPLCSTCGAEKPDKKCSKCKEVQYCNRECQRLHWFMHKKACARLSTIHHAIQGASGNQQQLDDQTESQQEQSQQQNDKKNIDANEISEQLQNLLSG